MKLLLFSDVHCHPGVCRALVEKSQAVDVVIGAGDFGQFRSGLEETIQMLRAIRKPTVLVPGNSESFEELLRACAGWSGATVLHGSGVRVAGEQFFGIGGGIPVTPFGSWSWDFPEEQAQVLLQACPKHAVLVSHSPPRGVVDVSSRGQSLGSMAVREAILEKKPRLVVCGHIHECGGQHDFLNGTPVVNAGPGGVIWELPPRPDRSG